jgi:hypothetical protein
MTLQERSDLILAFARVLYVNGQATEQTVGAAEELGLSLGLRARIIPRWGELELQAEDKGGSLFVSVAADPTGVDMDRVAATMRAIKDLGSGRLAPDKAVQAFFKISRAPPAFCMRSRGRRRGAGRDLRCRAFGSCNLDFRERGERRRFTSRSGKVKHERVHPTVLCGTPRRPDWRSRGYTRSQLVATSCRSLSMHGPGTGTAFPQQRVGPY